MSYFTDPPKALAASPEDYANLLENQRVGLGENLATSGAEAAGSLGGTFAKKALGAAVAPQAEYDRQGNLQPGILDSADVPGGWSPAPTTPPPGSTVGLTPEAAREIVGHRKVEISPFDTAASLQSKVDQSDLEQWRSWIHDRRQAGTPEWLLNQLPGVAASLTDPLALFIPFGGQAWRAAMVARGFGLLPRLGLDAALGVGQSVALGAAELPLRVAQDRELDDDASYAAALQNLVAPANLGVGAALGILGGRLHGAHPEAHAPEAVPEPPRVPGAVPVSPADIVEAVNDPVGGGQQPTPDPLDVLRSVSGDGARFAPELPGGPLMGYAGPGVEAGDRLMGAASVPALRPLTPEVVATEAGRLNSAVDAVLHGEPVDVAGIAPGQGLGVEAWHGSAQVFDRFSAEAIGTGEGAQAYGHGLYFAENRGLAETYAKNVPADLAGRDQGPVGTALRAWDSASGDIESAVASLESNRRAVSRTVQRLRELGRPASEVEAQVEQIKRYTDAIALVREGKVGGALYRVRLNVDPDRLLDWDKPLSEQPAPVREALEKLGIKPDEGPGSARIKAEIARLEARQRELGYRNPRIQDDIDRLRDALGEKTGEQAYKALSGENGPVAASKALHEAGVHGIRYLDASSRQYADLEGRIADLKERLANLDESAPGPAEENPADPLAGFTLGETPVSRAENLKQRIAALEEEARKLSRNHVVFDENRIRILERNGQAVDAHATERGLDLTPEERTDAAEAMADGHPVGRAVREAIEDAAAETVAANARLLDGLRVEIGEDGTARVALPEADQAAAAEAEAPKVETAPAPGGLEIDGKPFAPSTKAEHIAADEVKAALDRGAEDPVGSATARVQASLLDAAIAKSRAGDHTAIVGADGKALSGALDLLRGWRGRKAALAASGESKAGPTEADRAAAVKEAAQHATAQRYVRERLGPLSPKGLAEHLGVPEDDARLILDRLAARGEIRKLGQKYVRPAGSSSQQSALEYVARNGGIDVLERRELSGDVDRFVPGAGKVFRQGGTPIDGLAQSLIEGGYLHEGATDEDAVALLERDGGAMSRKDPHGRVYPAGEVNERSEALKAEETQAHAEQAHADLDAYLADSELRLSDDERREVVASMLLDGVETEDAVSYVLDRQAAETFEDYGAHHPADADDIPFPADGPEGQGLPLDGGEQADDAAGAGRVAEAGGEPGGAGPEAGPGPGPGADRAGPDAGGSGGLDPETGLTDAQAQALLGEESRLARAVRDMRRGTEARERAQARLAEIMAALPVDSDQRTRLVNQHLRAVATSRRNLIQGVNRRRIPGGHRLGDLGLERAPGEPPGGPNTALDPVRAEIESWRRDGLPGGGARAKAAPEPSPLAALDAAREGPDAGADPLAEPPEKLDYDAALAAGHVDPTLAAEVEKAEAEVARLAGMEPAYRAAAVCLAGVPF